MRSSGLGLVASLFKEGAPATEGGSAGGRAGGSTGDNGTGGDAGGGGAGGGGAGGGGAGGVSTTRGAGSARRSDRAEAATRGGVGTAADGTAPRRAAAIAAAAWPSTIAGGGEPRPKPWSLSPRPPRSPPPGGERLSGLPVGEAKWISGSGGCGSLSTDTIAGLASAAVAVAASAMGGDAVGLAELGAPTEAPCTACRPADEMPRTVRLGFGGDGGSSASVSAPAGSARCGDGGDSSVSSFAASTDGGGW